MKNVITFLILLMGTSMTAQIGINTTTPSALLDVNGNTRLDGSLYLENPGRYDVIRGSKFLINTTANEIIQYSIEESRYGPINYAEFIFKKTKTTGLSSYDTKISTTDYLVTVQGYYFAGPDNDTNIMPHSNLSDENIEGFQMYAYRHKSTNTWHVSGKFNNASFRAPSGGTYRDVQVDIHMNLIIYRNNFISKTQENIVVNMGGAETKTAPLPDGF